MGGLLVSWTPDELAYLRGRRWAKKTNIIIAPHNFSIASGSRGGGGGGATGSLDP